MDADSSTAECHGLGKSSLNIKKTGDQSGGVNASASFKAESPSSTTTDIQSSTSLMDLDDHADGDAHSSALRANNNSKRFITHNRERWSNLKCRQQNVNGAFNELRRLVPTYPHDKKLSKNEILRLAIKYIRLLSNVLDYQKEQEHKSGDYDSQQETASENNAGMLNSLNYEQMSHYACTYRAMIAQTQPHPPPSPCGSSLYSPAHFLETKTGPIQIEIPKEPNIKPQTCKRKRKENGPGSKRNRANNCNREPSPPEFFGNSSLESSCLFFTDSDRESDL